VRARGFTLVEVMVALAIVAITLPALLMALYQQVDDAAYLRDKMLAEMIAVNKLTEMRLVVASTRQLNAGKDSGVTTFVDREWYWWLETKTTEVDKFFRTEIRVALNEERREQPLYMLSAFMFGDLQIDLDGLQGDPSNPQDDPGGPSNPSDSGNPTDPGNPGTPVDPGTPGSTPGPGGQ
jgi:general secretion pathway protein I